MGDIAEMMIAGYLCEICGCVIDDKEPGYPRECKDCRRTIESEAENAKARNKRDCR